MTSFCLIFFIKSDKISDYSCYKAQLENLKTIVGKNCFQNFLGENSALILETLFFPQIDIRIMIVIHVLLLTAVTLLEY